MSSTTLRGAGYSGNITELYDALKEVWQSDMMALINDGTMFPKYRWDFYDLGNGVANVATLNRVLTPTFTRVTGGSTTVGPDGYIIKGIPANTPRSWYNPTTLAYEGLLMEPSRTNIVVRSEEFATTWADNGRGTVTSNTQTSPDNELRGDTFTANTNHASGAALTQTITAPAGPMTASLFVKKGASDHVAFGFYDTVGGTKQVFGWFNLNNGTVGTNGSNTWTGTFAITPYPNGWYRLTATGTTDVTTLNYIIYTANADGSFACATGDSVHLFGAQIEVGSYVTSYMPTTVFTYTRGTDDLTYPLSGTDVSVSVTWYPNALGLGLQVPILELYTDVNNRCILFQETTNQAKWYVEQAVSLQADPSAAGTLSNGVETTTAAKSANNNFAIVRDGGTVVTDVSGTAPAWTTIRFGNSVGGAATQGTRFRAATLFDRAVEDAHLQGMT